MKSGGITEARAKELIIDGVVAGVLGGPVTEIRVLTGGGGAATLEIAGKNGVFIAKVVEPGQAAEGLKKYRRLGEFMATLGIPAPCMELLEVSGAVIGIYRKMKGEEFSIENLPEEEREIFVRDMAGLLDRMHAVPLDDACRVLGIPAMTREEMADRFHFGWDWFNATAFEKALSVELAGDLQLRKAWDEDWHWFESVRNLPDELVFGHGDLHSGNVLLAKRPEGYRFAGVVDLQLGGIVHLYDEFLRILLLGGKVIGPRIIEAYNRLAGHRKKIDQQAVRHAERAFAFYLAHENSGESRKGLLQWAKKI